MMQEFQYTVTNPEGINAKCAALLVEEAARFTASIILEKDQNQGDAKMIFAVLGLAVGKGTSLAVKISGPDEAQALLAMQKFFQEKL